MFAKIYYIIRVIKHSSVKFILYSLVHLLRDPSPGNIQRPQAGQDPPLKGTNSFVRLQVNTLTFKAESARRSLDEHGKRAENQLKGSHETSESLWRFQTAVQQAFEPVQSA